MPFTFECGSCHAVYRLDEHQITAAGVKITCPRCMNYFFLKRGGVESAQTPVVEYVVNDGPQDVSNKDVAFKESKLPPKSSSTKVAPVPPPDLNRTIEEDIEFALEQDDVLPLSKGGQKEPVTQVTQQLTEADLSDLPPDPPKLTSFDQVVILGLAIPIMIVILLFLNFEKYISIPGLQRFQKSPEAAAPVPDLIEPEAQRTPKYGFPKMDPGYDPWTGTPTVPDTNGKPSQ